MKKSRFNESQIIGILKRADAGMDVLDLCRDAGISRQTFYTWKKKYGGMDVSDIKKMRELEAENIKLKKMYAEMALINEALKDVIEKKL